MMRKDPLKLVLLAYPDNPMGTVFLQTFLNADLLIRGVVIEQKRRKANLLRLMRKLRNDGMSALIRRLLDMFQLKTKGKRVVDIAERHHIPVFHFQDMNSQDCADLLETLQPDLLVIASAPILEPKIFTKARLGCLNPHPGWLPKYRGLGANAYAVLNQELPGITIHFVNAGIDTGRIIVREQIPIQPGDTIAGINDRAMSRGAELMVRVIRDIQQDRLTLIKINETRGKLYRAMPYREARKLNQRLKRGSL